MAQHDVSNAFSGLSLSSGSRSGGSNHGGSGGSGGSGPEQTRRCDEPHNFLQLAPRPGLCKVAVEKINIEANYFRIKYPSDFAVHSYNLEFTKMNRGVTEPVTKREKTCEMFWLAVDEYPQIFPRNKSLLIYNDVNRLFSSEQLRLRDGYQELKVQFRPKDANGQFAPLGAGGGRGRKEFFNLMIKSTGLVRVHDSLSQSAEDRTFVCQFFDLLVSQPQRCSLTAASRRFIVNGRSLYKIPTMNELEDVRDIGCGQQVWTGLTTAFKTDTEMPLLNVDTCHSVFYRRGMLLPIFYAEILNGYKVPEKMEWADLAMHEYAITQLEKVIKGTKVVYEAPGSDRKKFKKVDSLTRLPASRIKFDMNGSKILIPEYFLHQYNYRLQAPELPCVKVMKKVPGQRFPREELYPLELCWTGEEPRKYKGRITDVQLAAMIRASTQAPVTKRNDILRLTREQGEHLGDNPCMDAYNVAIERKLLQIENVHVLPKPKLRWTEGGVGTDVLPDGSHSMLDHERKPYQPIKKCDKPIVPFFVFMGDTAQLEGRKNYAGFILQTLVAFGIRVNMDKGDLFNWDGKNFEVIKDMCIEVKTRAGKLAGETGEKWEPMLFFVFPRRHAKLYSAIKYYTDQNMGVFCQCILQQNLLKCTGNPLTNETSTNIYKKVLLKLGGSHYHLDGSYFKNWAKVTDPEQPTLFLGIDVSHPSVEERKKAEEMSNPAPSRGGRGFQPPRPNPNRAVPDFQKYSYFDCPRSVISVVGNTDIQAMNYGVSSRVLRLGQEMGTHMRDQIEERMAEFTKHTGKVPAHIVVYRDGISDTDFKRISYEECNAVECALKSLGTSATITYIVAQKRHHTRFFLTKPENALVNGNFNAPPGTLVESKIVSKYNFDFFLLSHFGALGTARPTHYTVIRDDWKPSSSFWQTLLYAHAYGYGRCPKPISLPAPLQYAHLAAKRAKQNYDFFKEFPSEDYIRSTEDIVRQDIERKVVTAHTNIISVGGMYYC